MKTAMFLAAILIAGCCRSVPPPSRPGGESGLILYADSVQGQRRGAVRHGGDVVIRLEENPRQGKWVPVNPPPAFTLVEESTRPRGELQDRIFRYKVSQSAEITFSNPTEGGRLETFQIEVVN